MCEWFDETCGQLFDHLDRRQVASNTVIIFLCDNGWAAPSTNAADPNQKLWRRYAQRSKSSPYETGIRTPILVSWPGHVQPQRDSSFGQSIDIFPTIAAIAGCEVPANLPGINLLDEPARRSRKSIFGVCNSTHNMTVGSPDDTLQYLWCIEHDWKLIQRFHGQDTTQYRNLHSWDTDPFHLYQIREDPHELHDFAKSKPEIVERLTNEIAGWRSSF